MALAYTMEAAAEGPPLKSEQELARKIVDLIIDDEVVTLSKIDDFDIIHKPDPETGRILMLIKCVSKDTLYSIGARKFKIIIPRGVGLAERCFYDLNQLMSVTFDTKPPFFKIPPFTFYNCTNLKSIIIENSNSIIIDDKAFKNCHSLTDFPFEYIYKIFGNENFYNCGFTTIDLSEAKYLRIIPERCFSFNPSEIEVKPRKIFFPRYNIAGYVHQSLHVSEKAFETDDKNDNLTHTNFDTVSIPSIGYLYNDFRLYEIKNLYVGPHEDVHWTSVYGINYEYIEIFCVPPNVSEHIKNNFEDILRDDVKFVEYIDDINNKIICQLEDGRKIKNPFCLPKIVLKDKLKLTLRRGLTEMVYGPDQYDYDKEYPLWKDVLYDPDTDPTVGNVPHGLGIRERGDRVFEDHIVDLIMKHVRRT